MIKVDIVEVTGRTFEGVKCLGMLPTSVPDSEFNIYVRWHADGRVTVDRSDSDETILTVGLTRLSKGAAFAQLMEDLATLYGMPVEVVCDPGVSGGQSGKMVGTYQPREAEATPAEAEATPVIDKAAVLAKRVDCLLNSGAAEAEETVPVELPGVGQWIMWQGFSYMVEASYPDGRMNLKPYGGYECVIPERPIAQLMAWGEVKWPTHACKTCGPRLSAWCSKCYPCDTWGRPLVAEAEADTEATIAADRTFSDRDLRDEVLRYLGDLADDFYVDGIVDAVIKDHNGAVSIDAIDDWAWSELLVTHHKPHAPTSAAFTPTMEEIIWAQTYTMIKPSIRTKLAKRSRKSARRARRGCKGGVR